MLDNFEHLLAGAPLLDDLLDAAPRLTLLVTSRAALDLRREQRLRDFLRRKRAGAGGRQLDRQPQPSDAAAHRSDRLSGRRGQRKLGSRAAARAMNSAVARAAVTAVHSGELGRANGPSGYRLDDMLVTLGSGGRDAPGRQRTLRATLDWSYHLLGEADHAEFVAGELRNGVSLYNLMDDLGARVFTSTQRHVLDRSGNTNPRHAYMRQPDRRALARRTRRAHRTAAISLCSAWAPGLRHACQSGLA